MAKTILSVEVHDKDVRALEERIKKLRESMNRMPLSIDVGGGRRGGGSDGTDGAAVSRFMASGMDRQIALLHAIASNTHAILTHQKEETAKLKAAAGSGAGAGGGGGAGTAVAAAAGGANILGRAGLLSMAGMAARGLGGVSLVRLATLATTPSLAGAAVVGGILGGAAIVSGINLAIAGVKSAVGFGLGLATGGLAGNLFGLDRLALTGAAGRRTALGLGIDYGSMRAGQNVFGTTFDPNAVMGKVAEAKADFTSDAALALITTGARSEGTTGDVMLRLREQARQFALRTPENQLGPMSEVYGYNQYFSTQDLRRLKRQSNAEFEEDTKTARARAEQFALSDENLRKWQKFSVTLDAAGIKVETAFLKNLDKVTPQLEQMSEGLSNAIVALLQGPGFANLVTMVSEGLETFGKYVARGDFQKDLESLSSAVATVARAIINVASFLSHPIGSTVGAIAGPNVGAAASAGAGMAWKYNPVNPMFVPNAFGAIHDFLFPPAAASERGGFGANAYKGPAFAGLEPTDADFKRFLNNISGIESGGNYRAMGPWTGGDRAYGKYQVMGANIGPWSKQVLGRSIDISEFLYNPQLQEQIAQAKLREYVQKFGYEGAGQAWFGGEGSVGRRDRRDVLGTSVGDYGSRAASGLPQHVIVNSTVKVENATGANVELNTVRAASSQ